MSRSGDVVYLLIDKDYDGVTVRVFARSDDAQEVLREELGETLLANDLDGPDNLLFDAFTEDEGFELMGRDVHIETVEVE